MAKQQRPSLLSGMLASKGRAVEPALEEETPAPAKVSSTPKDSDGRVQVLVRMTPAERKALRRIALEQDTTVQALVEELLRDLIARHGG
ncbi:ribbon-helix-helix domain-containing protein [Bosea rubneri]|uniref:Ribbon-helix-helix domain-containing protein n=1 Tax=Bosea rubneri TaxID=3075434 RepID=A0ABU3SGM1_9HYPH|nr:ribbon-helix-helix domain-containing protein [Bosea sp. ZW T0_25]MDU0343960.1 ribbon-helix-helix domain-containing protein [Bosea sp. ZW T0_25]